MLFSRPEALEARIAPATLVNPLPDLVAGFTAKGAVVDLGNMFDEDAASPYRTRVEFLTNYDTDPGTAGLQAGKIVFELFDEKAPITVQNFLTYVDGASYDGGIFHRSFDFGVGSGEGTDILQGGGFSASNLFAHIPTGPNLHNEFNPADPELQNTAGTIAMAKTGISPHTATSEWFVNLTDNSTILGSENNEGYTVFGRVIEGMDVVNAIGALPKANLQTVNTSLGALTDTPVQGGYTVASGVLPNTSELIQITDARVITPLDAVSDGLTYSVAVTNLDGGATKLVVPQLVGDTLNLKYKAGSSGVAKVTVTAKDGTGTVVGTDDFNVTVQPNLIALAGGTTLSSIVVPGDTGLARVNVWNFAGGAAKGLVNVKFYLSKATSADPVAVLLDDVGGSDILIGETLKPVNVLPGKGVAITTKVQVPTELVPMQAEYFRIIAEVTSPDGTRHIQEVSNFTDDNTTLDSGSVHQIFNAFGTFKVGDVVRKNVPLTYHDAGGNLVKVTLTGGGIGQLYVASDGSLDLISTNTNAASILSFTTKPGIRTDLGNVAFTFDENAWAMGSVNFGSVNLHGDFLAPGGLKSLTLGNLGDGDGVSHLITIGAFAPDAERAVKIRVGNVIDYGIDSSMPIGSISARDWSNTPTTATETLNLSSLGSLTSKGDLEANILIQSDRLLKSLKVTGSLNDATIQTNGNVGAVSLGAMNRSNFLVGTTAEEVNSGLDAFTLERSIGSFTVRGIPGQTYAMSESTIAAAHISAINLRSVDPNAAGDTLFGVIADTITRYQRGTVTLSKLDIAETLLDSSGDYAVQII